MRRFQVAIFDMDGTLVDNMSFHMRSWMALVRTAGIRCAVATAAPPENRRMVLEEPRGPLDAGLTPVKG